MQGKSSILARSSTGTEIQDWGQRSIQTMQTPSGQRKRQPPGSTVGPKRPKMGKKPKSAFEHFLGRGYKTVQNSLAKGVECGQGNVSTLPSLEFLGRVSSAFMQFDFICAKSISDIKCNRNLSFSLWTPLASSAQSKRTPSLAPMEENIKGDPWELRVPVTNLSPIGKFRQFLHTCIYGAMFSQKALVAGRDRLKKGAGTPATAPPANSA